MSPVNLHAAIFKLLHLGKMSSISDSIGETTTVGLDEITAGNKYVSDLPPPVPNIVRVRFYRSLL